MLQHRPSGCAPPGEVLTGSSCALRRTLDAQGLSPDTNMFRTDVVWLMYKDKDPARFTSPWPLSFQHAPPSAAACLDVRGGHRFARYGEEGGLGARGACRLPSLRNRQPSPSASSLKRAIPTPPPARRLRTCADHPGPAVARLRSGVSARSHQAVSGHPVTATDATPPGSSARLGLSAQWVRDRWWPPASDVVFKIIGDMPHTW